MVYKINSTSPQEPSINTIVLPCKVGDNLYREDGIWECVGFDCDQNGSWRVKLRQEAEMYSEKNYYHTRMVFSAFGKTVFTSKEEYEKVFPLKPLEKTEYIKRLEENQREHNNWLLR